MLRYNKDLQSWYSQTKTISWNIIDNVKKRFHKSILAGKSNMYKYVAVHNNFGNPI
jgi:hypothetical protein